MYLSEKQRQNKVTPLNTLLSGVVLSRVKKVHHNTNHQQHNRTPHPYAIFLLFLGGNVFEIPNMLKQICLLINSPSCPHAQAVPHNNFNISHSCLAFKEAHSIIRFARHCKHLPVSYLVKQVIKWMKGWQWDAELTYL